MTNLEQAIALWRKIRDYRIEIEFIVHPGKAVTLYEDPKTHFQVYNAILREDSYISHLKQSAFPNIPADYIQKTYDKFSEKYQMILSDKIEIESTKVLDAKA